nr:MAG TPA: hypothetical protein [Caudoviricetes sp.]
MMKMRKFDILIDNIKDIDTVYSKFVNTNYPFQASIARYVVSKLILSVDEVTGTNLKLNPVHCSRLMFATSEAKCSLLSKFNILPDNSAKIIKQLTAIDKIVSKVNRDNITQIGCSFYTDSFTVAVIFKSNNDHFDIDFTIIDGNTIDKVITYYNSEIQNVWSFKEADKEDMSKDDIILRNYGHIVTHFLSVRHKINNKRDNTPERLSYIYKVYLRNIADATGTPKSELDAQVENLFKIITHLADNFTYKKVSVIYMGARTVSAMFRVTHCDEGGLSSCTYDISITVEADENGCIESITGIAYHKDGIILYDKKDGLRPLENWWEVNKE